MRESSSDYLRRAAWFACWAGVILAAGCGGNNETPASADPEDIALIRIDPRDAQSSVSRNRLVRITFTGTVLPSSVHDQSIRVRTGGTFAIRPEGSFLVSGNVVEFDPTVGQAGGPNALGFPAGAQVLVEVPLFTAEGGQAANNFVQNVEGDPIQVSAVGEQVAFTTGSGWDDVIPGSPGVLRLEFVPAANAVGQVAADAAVTMVFSEPIDPATVSLGANVFMTNDSETADDYLEGIPSITFLDGSATRYTFQPVFGFGQGPFRVKVNFINPKAPQTFDPLNLPTDLGGNQIQDFTFVGTFDTEFDPNPPDGDSIREDFTTITNRDFAQTNAPWGTDSEVPFALMSREITTRVQRVDVTAILNNGGQTSLPDIGGGPTDEGRICTWPDPLIGPDFNLAIGFPLAALGRRQMNLYRAGELGGEGTVIRAAWAPTLDITTAGSYSDVIMRIGHKRPGLNLTDNSFSSEFDVDGFVQVFHAPDYAVPQSNDVNGGLPNDGFFDWPEFESFFDYDGTNDMLVDVQVRNGTVTQSMRSFHAVSGGCSCGNAYSNACPANNSIGIRMKESVFGNDLLVPDGTVNGIPNPLPAVELQEFEMATIKSVGTSLWLDSGSIDPDYLPQILVPLVQPGGATIEVRFSASLDGINEMVPWTTNINACDGFRYIRWQIILHANIFTGGRARVQQIEIPFIRGG